MFLGPKESKLFDSFGIPSRWSGRKERRNIGRVNQCVAEGDLCQMKSKTRIARMTLWFLGPKESKRFDSSGIPSLQRRASLLEREKEYHLCNLCRRLPTLVKRFQGNWQRGELAREIANFEIYHDGSSAASSQSSNSTSRYRFLDFNWVRNSHGSQFSSLQTSI